jgi:hypothetical protein
MLTSRLIRLEHSWKWGSFGVLLFDTHIFCATVEPPNMDNKKDISCIPPSVYRCVRFSSDTHPNTFKIMNVPGRDGVLFHAGNTKKDTAGCILLGQYHGKLGAGRAGLNSGATFNKFLEFTNDIDEFILTIKEEY